MFRSTCDSKRKFVEAKPPIWHYECGEGSSVMFVGDFIISMDRVLLGSGEIPFASITWPRNTILVQANWHLFLFSVTPAASSFFRTTCKRLSCSFLSFPDTKISSTWQTTPGRLLNISFIRRWKCSGALVIPKGSLLKQNLPYGIMNVVRSLEFIDNGTCQKLLFVSSLVNSLAPVSWARVIWGEFLASHFHWGV